MNDGEEAEAEEEEVNVVDDNELREKWMAGGASEEHEQQGHTHLSYSNRLTIPH